MTVYFAREKKKFHKEGGKGEEGDKNKTNFLRRRPSIQTEKSSQLYVEAANHTPCYQTTYNVLGSKEGVEDKQHMREEGGMTGRQHAAARQASCMVPCHTDLWHCGFLMYVHDTTTGCLGRTKL
jgi:hypothetical protein